MQTDSERNVIVDVIIPAFNEEAAITFVVKEIPTHGIREIVVVNNGSSDNTALAASQAGATTLLEARKGYGYACLRGIAYLQEKPLPPDIVVFLDGDYSDSPAEIPQVLAPILERGADLVIGSRTKGIQQKGSLLPQQVFGNWLATRLIHLLYRVKFSDLGPFRAIKYTRLLELNMKDTTYGWTVEMQVKAAKLGLSCIEVPVSYKKRIGVSKVAGTVKGTILAGYKIIWTILKLL